MADLKEGVAVVTGAGSGLGQALASRLCQSGIRVAGLGRRIETLEQTRHLAGSRMFYPYHADITDSKRVCEVVSDINATLGAITVLVNNAAVSPQRDFLDETADSFAETVSINLGGTVTVTRAVLESMVQTGFGRILNVSSFAGDAPQPTRSAYSVSKGAQRIFSEALIADLSDRYPDIIISTWMPGILATDMGVPTGISPDDAAIWGTHLALTHDRSLMGTIFERNQEILPPRSLRQSLKDLLLFKRPRPRVIAPETSA